jgi:hypothetical protein
MTDRQMQSIVIQVRELIEKYVANGESLHAAWLVTEVVNSWVPAGGADAEKWTISGYANVRDIVRKQVQRYKPDEQESDDDTQPLLLPNYKKVHRAYLIERGGKQTIVPVDKLTVAEALGIIDELTRCETGLRLHRNELMHYIDEVLIPNQAKNTAG